MLQHRFLQSRKVRLFALGALIGIAVFWAVYGAAPLNVANGTFCRGGFIEKDIQQHYAGWLFYRNSALGWPLGVTRAVNAPAGVSVAYTDSIPLLAVLCRPLAAAIDGTFQYFGWFTLICFALQGGFAALLCGLFADGLIAPLAGSLVFAASPILIERAFRHTSLGAQWLVLAALYCYFACKRQGRFASRGLFIINVLAVGIHPYFLPMTYAVTLALLLEYTVQQRRWLRPALFLGGNMVCTVLFGWTLGLFYGTSTSGGQALYGYFSMNLNALWNPVGVNGVLYSRLLPAQNQVNGNYDAFAYLGLGVLAALPVVLVLARKRLAALLRRHWALCAVCAVLTVFAVSNVITANGVTLATLPLPASLIKLFSVFRSGGRLFWPVYYLLMLAAFAGLARLPRGIVWVALFAAVQLWDVSPALIQRHDAMQSAQVAAEFPTEMVSDFWQAAAQYKHIESVQGMQADSLHLALWAADNGMTTNDPFAARYDETALAAERQTALDALAAGTPQDDTLYLFADEGAFLQAVEPVKTQAWCGRVASSGDAVWYVIAPELQGQTFDALCTPYNDAYPLRLADYTDALWNRGVLDSTKQTVCFADSPFARAKLEGAAYLCANGREYPILEVDDHDAGWLMVTLDIDDATILWNRELTTK
ncbi:DUF6311 domain-containing protein [Gemmiger sp.]